MAGLAPPSVVESAASTELCQICYTCELEEEPCVRLVCGHVFHANCILQMLTHRYSTSKITFGYLDCPCCKTQMLIDYEVPILSEKLMEQLEFKWKITEMSVKQAREEGYDREGRVVTEGDIYFGDLEGFALKNCTFYECNKCKEPYFGGMEDCQQATQSEKAMNEEDMLCKNCAIEALGYGKSICEKHGNEFIDWKCMFCCSQALFFCERGNGQYCTPCHNDAMAGRLQVKTQCTGGDCCPLGIPHHPVASHDRAKAKFPLGCSICRSEKLALIADNENAGTGANLEQREEMQRRFGHVHGHGLDREMQVVRH